MSCSSSLQIRVLAEEYWIVVKTTVVVLVLRVSVVRTTFCVLISCVKQQSVYFKKNTEQRYASAYSNNQTETC